MAELLATIPLNRYPDASTLEAIIAERYGVAPEEVLVTAGADAALEAAVRISVCPGRTGQIHSPTFEMIERYIRLAGGEVTSVPWLRGAFPLEEWTERVLKSQPSLLALVSPNNPTGLALTNTDLVHIAERAPSGALVALDLVYGELAATDLIPVARQYSNVVIIKSLSKVFGLAGLRLGFAIGHPTIISWMRVVAAPYPSAAVSLAVAGEVVQHPQRFDRYLALVRAQRDELRSVLTGYGFTVEPSEANFVFARGPRAHLLHRALLGLSVVVRSFAGRPGLDDALRITCPGTPEDQQRLIRAIQTALAPEAILFDMDGVLADVSCSYRACIMGTVTHFGGSVSGEAIAEQKQRPNSNNDWVVSQRILTEQGISVPIERIREVFDGMYWGSIDGAARRAAEELLFPRSILEGLRERFRLGIVTGRPRVDAEAFLTAMDIGDLFDVVVCMEDGPLKPAPDGIVRALRALGAESAWMIGDTPDDAMAAQAAGVVPIGFVPPGGDTEIIQEIFDEIGVVVTVESAEEFIALL
jgi:histidinol-phosphate aminotransferase